MAIDALRATAELAAAATRKAGFDPQPPPDPSASSTAAANRAEDDHDHGAGLAGAWHQGSALLLTVGAELLGFFAPDTQVWASRNTYDCWQGHDATQ